MGLLSWAVGPALPYVAGGVGIVFVGALATAGVQTWRIGNLKYDLNVANGKVTALQAAKDDSETKRSEEAKEARTAYQALSASCAARIPVTIQAGRTIERIVNAKPNADGSRGMCDAECVRSLVGQAEPQG